MPKESEQQELPAIVAHDKRHGGVLRVDMPMVPGSTLKERAEICLRALAISEGLEASEGIAAILESIRKTVAINRGQSADVLAAGVLECCAILEKGTRRAE